MAFKSGYVIIAGRTNVGKSTLFNTLVGERLSIISPKPQTTRNNILGIVTDKQTQMIFLDTPGILSARYRLHEFMNRQIGRAYQSADVLLGIVDGSEFDTSYDAEVRQTFGQWDIPQNHRRKQNRPSSRARKPNAMNNRFAPRSLHRPFYPWRPLAGKAYKPCIQLCAMHCQKAHNTTRRICSPNSPKDFLLRNSSARKCFTTCVVNCLMQRQSALRLLKKTAPKSISRPISLSNAILKKALSSDGGVRPSKPIGHQARKKIEAFLERPIYLDLHVKVYENWRKKDTVLRSLGYGLS